MILFYYLFDISNLQRIPDKDTCYEDLRIVEDRATALMYIKVLQAKCKVVLL